MTKYQAYSRRELKSRFWSWARRNVVLLVLVGLGVLVLLAVTTWLLLGLLPRTALHGYLTGVLHAGILAGFCFALWSAFLAQEGQAIWHVRGAWGEEFTRDELKRAKRKRLVWGWVDSITLKAGDIDHLVVTRQGGLVAVDSKWRNQHDEADRVQMAREAARARLRAEALARTVLKNERGAKHRSHGNPVTVRPVVVIWGATQRDVPEGARVDGIDFVAGRKFVDWLAGLEGHEISKEAGRDVVTRLTEFRASTWDNANTSSR